MTRMQHQTPERPEELARLVPDHEVLAFGQVTVRGKIFATETIPSSYLPDDKPVVRYGATLAISSNLGLEHESTEHHRPNGKPEEPELTEYQAIHRFVSAEIEAGKLD